MTKFYKCPENTELGEQIKSFFNSAREAAARADEYAHSWGATSYIQPAQYFEGGVDFLEFDEEREPDSRIWKKRTDLGDTPVWEPNCLVNRGAVVMDDTRVKPSNTWRRVYQSSHLTWKEVRNLFPVTYWLEVIHAKPTKDRQKDIEAVEAALEKKFFMVFLDFMPEGIRNVKKKAEKCARMAVMAERMRIALPVVRIDTLYAILKATQDENTEKRELSTPTLFIYNNVFYIGSDLPCQAEGLTEITEQEHEDAKKTALAMTNEDRE